MRLDSLRVGRHGCRAQQQSCPGMEGGAVFTGISEQDWTVPLLSQGQGAASCCTHCVELAGSDVFKYPSMLWASAFPRRRQRAFVRYTLFSPLQGQTLAGPTGNPLF